MYSNLDGITPISNKNIYILNISAEGENRLSFPIPKPSLG